MKHQLMPAHGQREASKLSRTVTGSRADRQTDRLAEELQKNMQVIKIIKQQPAEGRHTQLLTSLKLPKARRQRGKQHSYKAYKNYATHFFMRQKKTSFLTKYKF
jgi:hypothetical protein